jgi:hypothetical protein
MNKVATLHWAFVQMAVEARATGLAAALEALACARAAPHLWRL